MWGRAIAPSRLADGRAVDTSAGAASREGVVRCGRAEAFDCLEAEFLERWDGAVLPIGAVWLVEGAPMRTTGALVGLCDCEPILRGTEGCSDPDVSGVGILAGSLITAELKDECCVGG